MYNKPGSEHHVITVGHGIPLAVSLTGGQRNDVTELMPLLDAIPPVRSRRGPPPAGASPSPDITHAAVSPESHSTLKP